jgi:hypothetical protein
MARLFPEMSPNKGLRTMSASCSNVISHFRESISIDPYTSSFEDVADKILRLSQMNRRQLLSNCRKVLARPALQRFEACRVVAAKILVSLVPESSITIKDLLQHNATKVDAEIHFSLFCFLDKLSTLPSGSALQAELPLLLERYLINAKANHGSAAWMAGDLLGDHWPPRESVPILIKAAKEGRYVAGRVAAIHGIAHILERLPDSSSTVKSLTRLVSEVRASDRSQTVRAYAENVLRFPALH